jgi:hypothetical protein
MEKNPYESPVAGNISRRKPKKIDWFDLFVYAVCGWIAMGIIFFAWVLLHFVVFGYGIGD